MKIDLKKLLVWLAIAFIIVGIWVDPRGSAQSIGNFLGDVGHFLSELVFKTATFISGLGH